MNWYTSNSKYTNISVYYSGEKKEKKKKRKKEKKKKRNVHTIISDDNLMTGLQINQKKY